MRVLMWASSYGQTIGGGPVLAPLLVQALAARGYEIVVLMDRRPLTLEGAEERDGARIVRPIFRAALSGDRAAFRETYRQVTAIKGSLRPDLSYIFSSGYGEFFHHLTARHAPSPLVVTLHDQFEAQFFAASALVGSNLRAADWVTACSKATLRTALDALPQLGDRSSAISNALPMPMGFEPIMPEPGRVVYCGRLVAKKGVDLLLDAFARLAATDPSLRLDIVGDGPERPRLQAQAVALGIAGRTEFSGSLPHGDVYRRMGQAAFVVVPSRIEPFGLVALEAAQIGRAVIASDVGGLAEIVVPDRTGLLVPPDDVSALSSAMAALLAAPERAATLGRAARDRAVVTFSWDCFVDAYDELFRRLARRGPSP